eukprot:1158563-Pelagomonas_calceolata.AAC.5
MGSSTTPARHIHLIETKYCEDTRPSVQLEASNNTANCANNSKRSETLARKLHALSVQHAHKLTSTRRAIENRNTHHNTVTGALEQRAARNPRDPHEFPSHLLARETRGSLSQDRTGLVSGTFMLPLSCPRRQGTFSLPMLFFSISAAVAHPKLGVNEIKYCKPHSKPRAPCGSQIHVSIKRKHRGRACLKPWGEQKY